MSKIKISSILRNIEKGEGMERKKKVFDHIYLIRDIYLFQNKKKMIGNKGEQREKKINYV